MTLRVSYARLFETVWLLFWAYWILMALQVRRARKSEPGFLRFIHVAIICFIFALIGLPQFARGVLGVQLIGAASSRCFAGAVLLVFGLAFAVWARIHLGSYWSGTITLKEGHRVIRTGPYRLVRHPIYVGLWLAFLGSVIALGQLRGFLALALLVIAQVLKSRREEHWLEQDLGEEYRLYRKQVPAFVPFGRRFHA